MALIFNSLLLDAASIFFVFFIIIYFYITRNFNYWEKRGVYSISPKPFFGSVIDIILLRESVGCWLARKYKETYGQKFFGAYFMDKPTLVVRDVELVKNVLVKDAHAFLDRAFAPQEDRDPLLSKNLFSLRGKKWRHLRVKLSPTFTSGKMKKMFYLVDESGKQLSLCLGENALTGAHVDVKDIMSKYTAEVIASCAFGVTTNAQIDTKSRFQAIFKSIFERKTISEKLASSLLSVVPGLLSTLRLKTIAVDIENFVRQMFWDVVEQRKSTGLVRNDFVDLLMQIREEGEVRGEDAKDLEEINQDSSYRSIEYSKNDHALFEMKDDDFVAQAFVFLLAGFETSSSVLNYTLYELALNPDIQQKLRNEITTSLDKHGGKLSYEIMIGMLYLDMVVSETLRKYPTLPFLERVCLSGYKIPGTDVTIEKGTQIMIPVLGLHSDPSIYPEPDKYDPERFSAENKSKRSQYAYLPFGEGPRICIGMRFGQMQVKTALIHILKSFQVLQCAETPKEPLHYKPYLTIQSSVENIILKFKKL